MRQRVSGLHSKTTSETTSRTTNGVPSKINPSSVAAALGLIVVAFVGAIWTGMAVSEGAMGPTVLRFAASIAGGLYYLTLFRLATGRRFFQTVA